MSIDDHRYSNVRDLFVWTRSPFRGVCSSAVGAKAALCAGMCASDLLDSLDLSPNTQGSKIGPQKMGNEWDVVGGCIHLEMFDLPSQDHALV
jgi:hypothetical protein